MGHLSEHDYDDRWDERDVDDYIGSNTLDDPLDDGTQPLAPMQFDPLCELRGQIWPSNSLEAASFEYEIAHW